MTHSIPIGEILTQKGTSVWSVSPETTVLDAIKMMAEKNVGALLVTRTRLKFLFALEFLRLGWNGS